MGAFLEQYGIAIFVLVIIAVLIALASPLGESVRNALFNQVNKLSNKAATGL